MTVFLSRDVPKSHFIHRYCQQHQVELIARSLIKVEFLPVEFPATHWVFFTSGNSVKSYFNNNGTTDAKFAVMGQGTASVAKAHCELDFIGSGSPREVAVHFKTLLGQETVCFPISDQSMRSIQKQLPSEQVIDVISYRTVSPKTTLPQADIYLFTSPSNLEAIDQSQIPRSSRVIAIGPTTLKSIHHSLKHQSRDATVQSMIDMLITLDVGA